MRGAWVGGYPGPSMAGEAYVPGFEHLLQGETTAHFSDPEFSTSSFY